MSTRLFELEPWKSPVASEMFEKHCKAEISCRNKSLNLIFRLTFSLGVFLLQN